MRGYGEQGADLLVVQPVRSPQRSQAQLAVR
jgi:hypothetical protein